MGRRVWPHWRVGADPQMPGKGLWSVDYRKLLKIKSGEGGRKCIFQISTSQQRAEWIEGHESGN